MKFKDEETKGQRKGRKKNKKKREEKSEPTFKHKHKSLMFLLLFEKQHEEITTIRANNCFTLLF